MASSSLNSPFAGQPFQSGSIGDKTAGLGAIKKIAPPRDGRRGAALSRLATALAGMPNPARGSNSSQVFLP